MCINGICLWGETRKISKAPERRSIFTHCILNRLSHIIYWKSPVSILGTSGYVIYIFLEKIAKLLANSGDPDQTPHSVASDLGLHYLQTLLGILNIFFLIFYPQKLGFEETL